MSVAAGYINNQSGKIIATRGTLSVFGHDIVNDAGALQAAGDVTLGARNIQNTKSGLILSQEGTLFLSRQSEDTGLLQNIENASGRIGASGDVIIETGTYDGDAQSLLSAGGGLTLLARDEVRNDGQIFSGKAARVQYGSFINDVNGVIASQNGEMELSQIIQANDQSGSDATSGLVNHGAIQSIGTEKELSIEGSDLQNSGKILSNGNLIGELNGSISNSGAMAALGGDLEILSRDLSNSGVMTTQNQAAIFAVTVLTNTGQIAASKGVTLGTAQKVQNLQGGEIGSENGFIRITTDIFENIASRIVALKARLSIAADKVINRAGVLQGADVQMKADKVDNTDAATILATQGAVALGGNNQGGAESLRNLNSTVQGQTGVTLSVAALSNGGGTILSGDGDVSLEQGDAGSFDNTRGILQAAGDVAAKFSGTLQNAGVLLAHRNMTLDVGRFEQTAGTQKTPAMVASETGSADIRSGSFTNAGFVQTGSGDQAQQSGAMLKAGEIRLTTDSFYNTGTVTAFSGLSFSAKGDVTQNGVVVARHGDITARGNDITNSGQVTASGKLDIRADGSWLNQGTMGAGRGLIANAGSVFSNDGGTIGATSGDIELTAGKILSNRGGTVLASAGTVSAAAGAVDNSAGTLQAQNDVAIRAGSLKNVSGTLLSVARGVVLQGQNDDALSVSNTQGIIQAQNAVTLHVLDLENRSGQVLAMQGPLTIYGSPATSIDNEDGAIETTQDLNVTAGAYNGAGSARLTAGGQATLRFEGKVDNEGQIAASKDLTLRASSVFNGKGGVIASSAGGASITLSGTEGLSNAGTVQAAGEGHALNLSAQNNFNAATGGILSRGDMTLNVKSDLSNLGEFTAYNSGLGIRAAHVTNKNLIVAGKTLALEATDSLTNSGLIYGREGGRVSAGQAIVNHGGQIGADRGSFTVAATLLDNGAGGSIINTSGGLSINAGQIVNNSVLLQSGAGMSLWTAPLSNRDGRVLAQDGDLIISGRAMRVNGAATLLAVTPNDTGDLDNIGGRLQASGTLTVWARDVHNQGGTILTTGGDIALTSRQGLLSALENDGGTLQAGHDLTVHATRVTGLESLTVNGSLDLQLGHGLSGDYVFSAGQDVRLSLGGSYEVAAGGGVLAGGNVTLDASDISNRGVLLAGAY